MIEDTELLRRYASSRSEEAFAELVRRRIGLVYSVAVRHTRDAHQAQDVTQAVFTSLAGKAEALSRRPALVGWLCRSAHYAAAAARRGEGRRQGREQEAHLMEQIDRQHPEPDWNRLRPLLDEALNEMDERDRDAVLLRFFDGRSFAEVGAQLRLTENAARMRVERALDKLYAALGRRGVTSTTTALGVALAQHAGAAVPPGLAATVAVSAVTSTATVATGWGLSTFFMSTTKTTVAWCGAALVAGLALVTFGTVEARTRGEAHDATRARLGVLTARLALVEKRVQVETQKAAAVELENRRLLDEAKKVAAAPAAEPPVTEAMFQARFKRGAELANQGDLPEALRELLWCYDVGAVRLGKAPIRAGICAVIGTLARSYSPAAEALRSRRDLIWAKIEAGDSARELVSEYAALSAAANDRAAIIAWYDRLPAGDDRRSLLAVYAIEAFVEQRRYADALVGRPFGSISSAFEYVRNESPSPNLSEVIRQQRREQAISGVARDIEVLAGAGQLDAARSLITRLFAYDGSAATKEQVQRHLERAGQPALLAEVEGQR